MRYSYRKNTFNLAVLYVYNLLTNSYTILDHSLESPELQYEIMNLYVSDDATMIVGKNRNEGIDFRGFVWSPETGTISLKQWLKDNHAIGDFKGWKFESLNGISASGNLISGHGLDAEGNPKSFYIHRDLN